MAEKSLHGHNIGAGRHRALLEAGDWEPNGDNKLARMCAGVQRGSDAVNVGLVAEQEYGGDVSPPRSPDPAYITSVPVTLVAGVPALPVTLVAGVPALPVLVALPAVVVGAIVPVVTVAAFTVVPVVVVAAAPVPVVAPAWIPPLAGTPVIIRERRGLGLGDGSRPQTREP